MIEPADFLQGWTWRYANKIHFYLLELPYDTVVSLWLEILLGSLLLWHALCFTFKIVVSELFLKKTLFLSSFTFTEKLSNLQCRGASMGESSWLPRRMPAIKAERGWRWATGGPERKVDKCGDDVLTTFWSLLTQTNTRNPASYPRNTYVCDRIGLFHCWQ